MLKDATHLPPFSLLMPVHGGIRPQYFAGAIESVVEQSLSPQEIVLVKDGWISRELDDVIRKWRDSHSRLIRCIGLKKNMGMAHALQIGLGQCAHSLIARMDADDVSVEDRFEKQVSFLHQNPGIDVLGGWISEFSRHPHMVDAVRKVPITHEEIASMAPFRCPLNHMTVMYRKEAVLACGGYNQRFGGLGDYDLWARMLLEGSKMWNLPEVLVHARATHEFYGRRGGWQYARVELMLEREFLRIGFIGLFHFLFNVSVRLGVRLVPHGLRAMFYSDILRR